MYSEIIIIIIIYYEHNITVGYFARRCGFRERKKQKKQKRMRQVFRVLRILWLQVT